MEATATKPTDAFKNLGPIRWSIPIALDSSSISAPVFSHKAEKLLIEDIRWANIAFEANLESSEDQTLVVIIFSLGTQLE